MTVEPFDDAPDAGADDTAAASFEGAIRQAGAPAAGGRTEATRQRVLDATLESIIAYGISRSSMVDIAKTAGIGRTTLYRHWRDFDALLRDLMLREFSTVLDGLWLAPDTAEDLAAVIAVVVDRIRGMQLVQAIRKHEPERLIPYFFVRIGTFPALVRDLMRDALIHLTETDERVDIPDPTRTATMLLLIGQGTAWTAQLAEDTLPPETFRAELERVVLGYLLHPGFESVDIAALSERARIASGDADSADDSDSDLEDDEAPED